MLPDDALMMAVIHRHGHASPTPVLGMLQDWSTWRGAIARTVAHDSHSLVVFWPRPGRSCGGCQRGDHGRRRHGRGVQGGVTAVLRLPICGLLSDAPARMLRRIPRVARSGPCDRLLATTAVDFQGHRWCQPCVQSWSACQRRRDYRRGYRRYICERADSIGQGRCVRVAVPHQRLAGYLHRMVADWDCIVRILVRVADGRVNTWVKPGHDGVGAWPRRGWRVV